MNSDGTGIVNPDACPDTTVTSDSPPHGQAQRSAAEIQTWLVKYMADLLDMPVDNVETDLTFDRFGLDSAAAVALTSDVARWLGRDLDPELTGDYQTIAALSEHLAA